MCLQFEHCGQPPEVRRGTWNRFLEPPEGTNSADTSVSGSSLQNSERTNPCCFKPPSLWHFSMTDLGNKYILPLYSLVKLSSAQHLLLWVTFLDLSHPKRFPTPDLDTSPLFSLHWCRGMAPL